MVLGVVSSSHTSPLKVTRVLVRGLNKSDGLESEVSRDIVFIVVVG